MLTLEEFQYPLLYFRFLSTLCIIPFEVNVSRGSIKLTSRKWKKLSSRILWLLLLCHAVHTDIKFIYSAIVKELRDPRHLPLHLDIAIASIYACQCYYNLVFQHPQVTVTTFNRIFSAPNGKSSKGLPKLRRLGQYNRQELLALSIPFGNVTWILLFQLLYIVDPTANLFAFSSVPETHQTKFWFFFFMIEEWIMVTVAGGTLAFTMGLQIMFFEKVEPIIREDILAGETTEFLRLEDMVVRANNLRHLQLLLQWFNRVHAWLIFSFKNAAIAAGLAHGYCTIRYFNGNAFYTVLNGLGTIMAYCYFAFMYERTFTIPRKVYRCKQSLLDEARNISTSEIQLSFLTLCIRSVPDIGIKVGEFHTLKRTSTPAFVDFSVRNTARLLLFYR